MKGTSSYSDVYFILFKASRILLTMSMFRNLFKVQEEDQQLEVQVICQCAMLPLSSPLPLPLSSRAPALSLTY